MSVQHVRAAKAQGEAERILPRCRYLEDTSLCAVQETDDKVVCRRCGDTLLIPALDGLRQDILARDAAALSLVRSVVRRKPWYLRLWYWWHETY